MWLATGLGYFSIVRKNGEFFVRARSIKDLDILKKATGLTNKIIQIKNSDYVARIIVNQVELETIQKVLFDSITYPNFKDSIKHNPEQQGKTKFYTEVWGVMFDYQHSLKSKKTRIVEDPEVDICSRCSSIQSYGTMKMTGYSIKNPNQIDLVCKDCE